MKNQKGSLKSTIAVSLTNYLDAGAIVAGASGLTLWQSYLGLTEGHLGWLNAISANCPVTRNPASSMGKFTEMTMSATPSTTKVTSRAAANRKSPALNVPLP